MHGAAHVIKSAHNPGGTLKIEYGLDLVKRNGDLETASSFMSDLVVSMNLYDHMQHTLSKTVLAYAINFVGRLNDGAMSRQPL